jgi:hypothetical protein
MPPDSRRYWTPSPIRSPSGLFDAVAQVNPDAELDAVVGGKAGVATELDNASVAGAFYN